MHNNKGLYWEISKGDEGAFRMLYEQYWHTIHATALAYLKSPELAQDVVQETFIRVWKNRSKLPGIENPEGFIYVIARNRIKTALKKCRQHQQADEYYINIKEDPDQALEGKIALRQFRDNIYNALPLLPPQQALIFKMSRFEYLSYEEIARKLGLSPATVRNHLVKALNFMRSHFASRHTDLILLVHGCSVIIFLLGLDHIFRLRGL